MQYPEGLELVPNDRFHTVAVVANMMSGPLRLEKSKRISGMEFALELGGAKYETAKDRKLETIIASYSQVLANRGEEMSAPLPPTSKVDKDQASDDKAPKRQRAVRGTAKDSSSKRTKVVKATKNVEDIGNVGVPSSEVTLLENKVSSGSTKVTTTKRRKIKRPELGEKEKFCNSFTYGCQVPSTTSPNVQDPVFVVVETEVPPPSPIVIEDASSNTPTPQVEVATEASLALSAQAEVAYTSPLEVEVKPMPSPALAEVSATSAPPPSPIVIEDASSNTPTPQAEVAIEASLALSAQAEVAYRLHHSRSRSRSTQCLLLPWPRFLLPLLRNSSRSLLLQKLRLFSRWVSPPNMLTTSKSYVKFLLLPQHDNKVKRFKLRDKIFKTCI
ncbi:hypothetical protein ACFE04_000444 [Oxalis oulophora]